MVRIGYPQILFLAVLGTALTFSPPVATATGAAEKEGPPQGHKKVSGVVTGEKSGVVTVKTATGTLTLNPNAARRHGHALKEGQELTLYLDENNAVVDVHPKGDEGTHRFITGNLIYVGKTKKEIKLSTPDGEKVFPIERLEIKTGAIEEGALVTAEVNEAGTIIDLHRAKSQPGTQ
jgi:hypothetical protein